MLSIYVKLQVALKSLLTQEEGQDLIEYAMIVALIVIAAIAGMDLVGTSIAAIWARIGTELSSALPATTP